MKSELGGELNLANLPAMPMGGKYDSKGAPVS